MYPAKVLLQLLRDKILILGRQLVQVQLITEASWQRHPPPDLEGRDPPFQSRLERSKPVTEVFFTWVRREYEKNPVPKSMLGAALTYAVRQEG